MSGFFAVDDDGQGTGDKDSVQSTSRGAKFIVCAEKSRLSPPRLVAPTQMNQRKDAVIESIKRSPTLTHPKNKGNNVYYAYSRRLAE